MAVMAMPPKAAPKYFMFFLYLNVKRRRVRNCIIAPTIKAIPTERKIPRMTDNALSVLIRSLYDNMPVTSLAIVIIASAQVAPNNSKTNDTVVEVGKPKVLKRSSRKTSVIMAASRMYMMLEKTKFSGLNIPCRAISIIPLLNEAPTKTPIAAIMRMVRREAALLPTAEFKKFTASLLTPTTKSKMASTKIKMISTR